MLVLGQAVATEEMVFEDGGAPAHAAGAVIFTR